MYVLVVSVNIWLSSCSFQAKSGPACFIWLCACQSIKQKHYETDRPHGEVVNWTGQRGLELKVNVKVCKFCENLTEQNNFQCLEKTKGYSVLINLQSELLIGYYLANVSGRQSCRQS